MLSRFRCLLPVLLVVAVTVATAAVADVADVVANDNANAGDDFDESFWKFSTCDLECANGGYCRFVRGTADELSRKAQSGILVETCRCPSGYTGSTCQYDIVVEEEVPQERRCYSDLDDADTNTTTTTRGCDCSLADDLSDFAGRMCRKPVTEYCSGKFDIHKPLLFCTNGGRCRQDILGATFLLEEPGNDAIMSNTKNNAGCVCPGDFHGPHCEFLRMNDIDNNNNNNNKNKNKNNNNNDDVDVDVKSTTNHDKMPASQENGSSSSLRTTINHETKKKSSDSDSIHSGVLLLFLFSPILIGLLAVVVYTNRVARSRRFRKNTKLSREWNESIRTSNSSNNYKYYFATLRVFAKRYLVWRRRSTTTDNTVDLSRTWDQSSDTSSDNSGKVNHSCYSYEDDGDDESIDEGIIIPGKKHELETVYEEKERRGSF